MISFDFHHLGAFFRPELSRLISYRARPPLKAPSWILNLKMAIFKRGNGESGNGEYWGISGNL